MNTNIQSIYLAILILLITFTILANGIFYFSNNIPFIIPICTLVLTSLYVLIPIIIYAKSNNKKLNWINNKYFKIYSILILLSLSSLSISGALYADYLKDQDKNIANNAFNSIVINFYIIVTMLGIGVLGVISNEIFNIIFKRNRIYEEKQTIIKKDNIQQLSSIVSIIPNN